MVHGGLVVRKNGALLECFRYGGLARCKQHFYCKIYSVVHSITARVLHILVVPNISIWRRSHISAAHNLC